MFGYKLVNVRKVKTLLRKVEANVFNAKSLVAGCKEDVSLAMLSKSAVEKDRILLRVQEQLSRAYDVLDK